MYRLRTGPEKTISLQVTASGAKTVGQAALINGMQGFFPMPVDDAALGVFVTEAEMVEVDVESAAYNAGDALYEHATVPTGTLNKTSSSRTKVGYVLKDYPSGTTKVVMRFTGGNI